MLDEHFILQSITPYLNVKRELLESEFAKLFSCLEQQEQAEVIRILSDHGIRIVPEEAKGETSLDPPDAYRGRLFQSDGQMGNEQLCLMIQQENHAGACAALIKRNKGFVHREAWRLHNAYPQADLSLEDLCQEGAIGLILAAYRFDPSIHHVRFLTYAWYWVRKSMRWAIIHQGYPIRIPVHAFETLYHIYAQWVQHSDWDEQALWSHLDSHEKKYLGYAKQYFNVPSLNQPVGEGQTLQLQDFQCAPEDTYTEEQAFHAFLRYDIQDALRTLKPRERAIVCYRFGLDGRPPETLEQVGRHYQLTRERIRQIENKALRKLRHPTCSQRLRDYYEE